MMSARDDVREAPNQNHESSDVDTYCDDDQKDQRVWRFHTE